jgi:hypothetical protein
VFALQQVLAEQFASAPVAYPEGLDRQACVKDPVITYEDPNGSH